MRLHQLSFENAILEFEICNINEYWFQFIAVFILFGPCQSQSALEEEQVRVWRLKGKLLHFILRPAPA